jgi:hypothetical protein
MTDFIAGPVSPADTIQFDHVQQLANQPQVQVFDANAQNSRVLVFAFA